MPFLNLLNLEFAQDADGSDEKILEFLALKRFKEFTINNEVKPLISLLGLGNKSNLNRSTYFLQFCPHERPKM